VADEELRLPLIADWLRTVHQKSDSCFHAVMG
jgi:hypothetical protein